MTTIVTVTRNKFITFAKAFSILTIVLYHYLKDLPLAPVLSRATVLGGGGIYLFLFASGYGLYLSKYTGFSSFIKRRFSKVIIPYYIAITVIFLLNIFLKIYPVGIDAWLSHMLLYKMFVEQYESSYGGQFWFISTIVQFYLLFPLLRALVKNYRSLYVIIFSLLISMTYAVVIAMMGIDDRPTVNRFFLQYLWVFVLGMAIAKTNILDKVINVRWYYMLMTALLSYLIMIVLALKGGLLGKEINDPFSFIGYVGITICLYHLLNQFKRALNLIVSVEAISYSLFLTHYLVYDFFAKFVFHPLGIIHVPIVFIIALITAWAFNYVIYTIPGYFKKNTVV